MPDLSPVDKLSQLRGRLDHFGQQVPLRPPELAEQLLCACQDAADLGAAAEEAQAYYLLGRLTYSLNNPDRLEASLRYFQRALDINSAQDNPVARALYLNAAATVRQRTGEFELALQQFSEALTLAKLTDNQKLQFFVLNNLAVFYLDHGHPAEAVASHQGALSAARKQGDKESQFVSLMNLMEAYSSLEDHAPIAGIYEELLELRPQISNPYYLTSFQRVHGLWLLAEQKHAEAQNVLVGALAQSQQENYDNETADILLLLTRNALRLEQPQQAQTYIDQALHLSQKLEKPTLQCDAHLLQSQVYEHAGKYQEALAHLKLHLKIKQSLQAKLVAAQTYSVQAQGRIELLQREMEIERLRNVELAQVNQALQQTQAALLHRATHDSLTGIPNRAHFRQQLEETLAHLGPEQEAVVAFVDLDEFKEVNDTYDHTVGDELLLQVVRRLQRNLPQQAVLGRLGGDEFVVLLSDLPASEAEGWLRALPQTLQAPFDLFGHQVNINASVGYALYPRDGLDASTLLRNADVAMYHAKHNGGNAAQAFESGMLVGRG